MGSCEMHKLWRPYQIMDHWCMNSIELTSSIHIAVTAESISEEEKLFACSAEDHCSGTKHIWLRCMIRAWVSSEGNLLASWNKKRAYLFMWIMNGMPASGIWTHDLSMPGRIDYSSIFRSISCLVKAAIEPWDQLGRSWKSDTSMFPQVIHVL